MMARLNIELVTVIKVAPALAYFAISYDRRPSTTIREARIRLTVISRECTVKNLPYIVVVKVKNHLKSKQWIRKYGSHAIRWHLHMARVCQTPNQRSKGNFNRAKPGLVNNSSAQTNHDHACLTIAATFYSSAALSLGHKCGMHRTPVHIRSDRGPT